MAITLFVLFLLIALLNILYYIGYFSFAAAKPFTPSVRNIPVSVIVCAKNEAENLKRFIPLILEQNYSNFELILINDASTDETLDIMEEFQFLIPVLKLSMFKTMRHSGEKKSMHLPWE
jgi:cellulose synthase/poly-beta-1,6-N-acetylglucosamine synthase-like glycosyltransferase